MSVELRQQASDVRLHGKRRDMELSRDDRSVLPFSQQPEHFHLATREGSDSSLALTFLVTSCSVPRKRKLNLARFDQHLSGRDPLDGLHHGVGRLRLRQEGCRSGLDRLTEGFITVIGGQKNERTAICHRADRDRCVHT